MPAIPEVEGTMGQVPGGVHLISTPEDVATLELSTNPEQLAYRHPDDA